MFPKQKIVNSHKVVHGH